MLEKYHPKNCLTTFKKVSTIDDAINTSTPSIGLLQRAKGKEFSEVLITFWLVYLNNILNLNKPMSEDQIRLCSSMIVEEYYMLKISDITLIFKRIISGQYGEFYERLSIDKVMIFFRTYLAERFNQAADNSLRNHENNIYKLKNT